MPPPSSGNLATWLWRVTYSALAMAALFGSPAQGYAIRDVAGRASRPVE
jgi:hypothetical protein